MTAWRAAYRATARTRRARRARRRAATRLERAVGERAAMDNSLRTFRTTSLLRSWICSRCASHQSHVGDAATRSTERFVARRARVLRRGHGEDRVLGRSRDRRSCAATVFMRVRRLNLHSLRCAGANVPRVDASVDRHECSRWYAPASTTTQDVRRSWSTSCRRSVRCCAVSPEFAPRSCRSSIGATHGRRATLRVPTMREVVRALAK